MSQIPTLDDDEYLEIEETISTSVRGRAFLRMRDQRASVIASDQVRRLVGKFQTWFQSREHARSDMPGIDLLHHDLRDLRDHIERSKGEIAAIVGKGNPISGARLNGATEELYEIVASTERATSEILSAAERIQELSGELGGSDVQRQELENRCMEIFTACSFQDITGQRIAKVVATMAYIEQRVNTMVSMWDSQKDSTPERGLHTGITSTQPRSGEDLVEVNHEEAHLLNGPQMPGKGLEQDAVDALFGAALGDGGSPPKAAGDDALAATIAANGAGSAAKAVKPKAAPLPRKAVAPAAKAPAAPAAKAPVPAKPANGITAGGAPGAAKLDQSSIDALFN